MAKLAFNFGDRWKNIDQLPTIEHNLFFQYLIISPSYWKAHLIRKGQLTLSDKSLPKDIKKVIKIYDLFGDIFLTPFEVWWEATGCNLFYSGTDIRTLNIMIDITKSKISLLKQIEEKIDDAQSRRKNAVKPKVSLAINKIQPFSLFEKLQLIEEKAKAYRDQNPKLENWKIALLANLETKWKSKLNEGSKPTSRNESARAYLGMLVSKNIAEAVAVAENAARGDFPSKVGAPSKMRLDYEHLSKLFYERFKEEVEYMWDTSSAGGSIKHHDYTNTMMRQLRKKMRSKKRLERLVEKEVTKRTREKTFPLD
jgi:hypothetical protein